MTACNVSALMCDNKACMETVRKRVVDYCKEFSDSFKADGEIILEKARICSVCRAEAPDGFLMKKCSRCWARYYCSTECQKTDWKTHKLDCWEEYEEQEELEKDE